MGFTNTERDDETLQNVFLIAESVRGTSKRVMSDCSASTVTAFSRHSSFDQIIKVVERERSLLYGFASEPSSPAKKLNFGWFFYTV